MKKIAIVGGGPSGVFSAIKILEFADKIGKKPEITIFDNKNILHTILPTGNGRCNLCYMEFDNIELAKNFPRGEKFLYSVFSRYGTSDTIADFENLGVETYIQDDLRIFPKENSSAFVKQKMLEAIYNKVKFERKEIKEKLNGFDAVIIATGLKTYPKLAEIYGHKIEEIKPALCGLKIKEKKFLTLKGVSFNKVIFTDVGVSGPYIFKLSSINAYKKYPYEIKIPLISPESLKEKLIENPKKQFKTIVSAFIPNSLANILIKTDKKCANVSKKEIEELEFLTLTVTSPDNKGEIVHSGGVNLDEIDKNFKSKIAKNLWIIGEVLNIDGFTGGFNLQNCWSDAAICAQDVIKTLYS